MPCGSGTWGKRFSRRGRWVLDGIDLDAATGTITLVAGGNGSGKTTLLRVAAGASRPSVGRVAARPASVGYVPEQLPARLRMTAAQYIAHMGRIRGLGSDAVADRSRAMFDRLGLSPGPNSLTRRIYPTAVVSWREFGQGRPLTIRAEIVTARPRRSYPDAGVSGEGGAGWASCAGTDPTSPTIRGSPPLRMRAMAQRAGDRKSPSPSLVTETPTAGTASGATATDLSATPPRPTAPATRPLAAGPTSTVISAPGNPVTNPAIYPATDAAIYPATNAVTNPATDADEPTITPAIYPATDAVTSRR